MVQAVRHETPLSRHDARTPRARAGPALFTLAGIARLMKASR